jgi:hypothetical protein
MGPPTAGPCGNKIRRYKSYGTGWDGSSKMEMTDIDVISASSGESSVLEMGEGECGFDDVADLAWAGGEVS